MGVRLLGPPEGPPAEWPIEYFPVIELHHARFDCEASVRAAELIAKNGIHAGVVRNAGASKRCALGDVPLDAPVQVSVDGEAREAPVLRDLVLDGAAGPLATVAWLHRRLAADGEALAEGMLLLTATPGSLHPVAPAPAERCGACARVRVEFDGMSVECTVE